MQGDMERAAHEARSLIDQFSKNEDALESLADQTADLGKVELALEAGLKRFPESGGLGVSLSRLSAER